MALYERIAQCGDQVLVGLELALDDGLLLLEKFLDPSTPVAVTEHAPDQVAVVEGTALDGDQRDERAGHTGGADHLRRHVRRVEQISTGTGGDVVEEQLLGDL